MNRCQQQGIWNLTRDQTNLMRLNQLHVTFGHPTKTAKYNKYISKRQLMPLLSFERNSKRQDPVCKPILNVVGERNVGSLNSSGHRRGKNSCMGGFLASRPYFSKASQSNQCSCTTPVRRLMTPEAIGPPGRNDWQGHEPRDDGRHLSARKEYANGKSKSEGKDCCREHSGEAVGEPIPKALSGARDRLGGSFQCASCQGPHERPHTRGWYRALPAGWAGADSNC